MGNILERDCILTRDKMMHFSDAIDSNKYSIGVVVSEQAENEIQRDIISATVWNG